MNAPDDLLRYYYEMGYFRGRADALDGRPYDARLPHERENGATPLAGTGATRSTSAESERTCPA